MTGGERLGRSRRLVRGTEIRHVLRAGRRSRRSHLDIRWVPSPVGHGRLGLIVPRMGESAVRRNRLRRRLKELWRREIQARVGPLDVVLCATRASHAASFSQLREELLAWAADVAQ